MSSAHYYRTCLWSAVDFERNIYFCLARQPSFPPTPADARVNLRESHFLDHFTPIFLIKSSKNLLNVLKCNYYGYFIVKTFQKTAKIKEIETFDARLK